MSRLNLRAMIPFAIGLMALLFALFALMQMLVAERSDARASLDARERLVLDYAANEFASHLAERLEQAELETERALENPLLPCRGCYYSEGDQQLLPRLGPNEKATPAGPTPVRNAYAELQQKSPTAGSDTAAAAESLDPTWAQRVQLHRACADGEPNAGDALLEHRGLYILPIEQEIASTLALVEQCQPAAGLLPALLRDGMAPPGGRQVAGLQPMVLRHLHRLGPADGAFIVQRVIDVSRALGIETNDFQERLTELEAAPLALPDRKIQELSIASGDRGHWLVQPGAAGARGVALDLGAILGRIAQKMRNSSLLESDDRIELRLRNADLVALEQVQLDVISPHLRQARADVAERHLLKLALLGLCGAMGLVICVLALALQRKRRRLLELKSHFIASVSHELRTPLASMRVMVETLARRTKGMPEVRDYPARVLSDIDGMSFLVENILSFNRLAKGQWRQRTEPVKLAEVVASACEEAEEWHSRPIHVQNNMGDVVIPAEPELLRLLFRNLALNAVNYNNRDIVEIAIDLGAGPGQELDVLFRDNGVGIDAADKSRVFDEFYRGSASSMARGSGLGLALCRRIMALHDGTIAVIDSSDEGTTFRLRFP